MVKGAHIGAGVVLPASLIPSQGTVLRYSPSRSLDLLPLLEPCPVSARLWDLEKLGRAVGGLAPRL